MSAQRWKGNGGLLRHPVLRTLLFSLFLLQIGIWIRNYAILLFIMEKTGGDPVAVSLISLAQIVPIFVFSLIGGTYSDRWKAKKTIIICDLLSALSIFIVLIALLYGSWQAVFFTTFFSAITAQFSQPASVKLMKIHANDEQVQTAMMVNQMLLSVFAIIGPVLGTIVYQLFGIYFSVAIMCVAFLLSAGVLTMLPPDRMKLDIHQQATPIRKELLAGLRYVFSVKPLVILNASIVVCGLALGLIQPLGIFLVTERLSLPKESIQWLSMASGVGMVIGGALMLLLRKKVSPPVLLLTGIAVAGGSISVAGYSTHFGLTMTAQLFGYFVYPMIQAAISILVLKHTEEAFVGRVTGLRVSLLTGSTMVGVALAGWLKGMLSVVVLYQFAAVLFALGFIIAFPLLSSGRKSLSENKSSLQKLEGGY